MTDYENDEDIASFNPKIDTLIKSQGIDMYSAKADYIRALHAQESNSAINAALDLFRAEADS